MKIVYVHQYFKTPESGGAIRSWHIARAMQAAGHQVEMITSHNNDEYKIVNEEGVTVHYYPVSYSNEMGFTERVKSYLQFVRHAKRKVSQMVDKPNLIYATSTPLTVAYLALWAKKKFNIPFIFEVRDLWPEAPIQMGALKSPFLKRYFTNLAKKAYDEAKSVIALSPGMFDGVKALSPESKVTCITNMSDIVFYQAPDDVTSEFDLANFPTLLYAGSLGKANDLTHFKELMQRSQELSMPLNVIVTGEGAEASLMEELSSSYINFYYLGMQPKDVIRHLYKKADLSIVSFKELPILETNSPNKFFDAMAAGTPVAINVGGWIADLCEEHKCGMRYKRTDLDDFIQRIYKLKAADELRAMSFNALTLAKSFEVERLTKRIIDLVEA